MPAALLPICFEAVAVKENTFSLAFLFVYGDFSTFAANK